MSQATGTPPSPGRARQGAPLDRVLLTNDDGIDAPGSAVLEAIAAELAREVWVVAPEHDQSGQSHAISLHHPIRVSERGPRRFGVTGTPGDCAVMGVSPLMPEPRRAYPLGRQPRRQSRHGDGVSRARSAAR